MSRWVDGVLVNFSQSVCAARYGFSALVREFGMQSRSVCRFVVARQGIAYVDESRVVAIASHARELF